MQRNVDNNLWRTAIHESAHAVVRFLLMGNIDIIEYIDIVQEGESLGRNRENEKKKAEEMYEAYMDDLDFRTSLNRGGYFFNECCYSLAGVIAEKVIFCLDAIPWEGAQEDLISFENQTPIKEEKIDCLIEKAIPETEALVEDSIEIINKLAASLLSAKDHKLDNAAILAVLTK